MQDGPPCSPKGTLREGDWRGLEARTGRLEAWTGRLEAWTSRMVQRKETLHWCPEGTVADIYIYIYIYRERERER